MTAFVLTTGQSPTLMDSITLAIAVAGFVLALAALGWQVVTFVASGSRVKVSIDNGFFTFDDGSLKPFIGVGARNIGRVAVDVDQWYFDITTADDDGKLVVAEPASWVGPTVPHRLEPGQSATWTMHAGEIRAALVAHGHAPDTKLRGRVTLGNGKDLRSKKKMQAPQFD